MRQKDFGYIAIFLSPYNIVHTWHTHTHLHTVSSQRFHSVWAMTCTPTKYLKTCAVQPATGCQIQVINQVVLLDRSLYGSWDCGFGRSPYTRILQIVHITNHRGGTLEECLSVCLLLPPLCLETGWIWSN